MAKDKRFASLSVLVVDDNEQTRNLVNMVLKRAGVLEVNVAVDGEAAWLMIQNRTVAYSVIICDWNMPRLNGIKLLERVRESYFDLPFLMITGRGSTDSVVDAQEMGVTAYMPKPFTPERLLDKLEAILFTDTEFAN